MTNGKKIEQSLVGSLHQISIDLYIHITNVLQNNLFNERGLKYSPK